MVTIRKVIEHVRIPSIKNGKSESSTPEFSRKSDVIYCLVCGTENLSEQGTCINCGKNLFLNKNASEIIGGYIELAKKNRLKSYYNKSRYTKSIVKMNPKRMIHQLISNKDKIDIKKETVDKIYGANI